MLPFLDARSKRKPLAEQLRPRSFDEVCGQDHLLAGGSQISTMLEARNISNMILWGPPGSGKTTIARILAEKSDYHFEYISAVVSGISHLKELFEKADKRKGLGTDTLLLVDEIHHLNRSQQDVFLPHLENGTITLIGATTENPSFELNSALLSRCKVLVVKALSSDALAMLMIRAEEVIDKQLPLTPEARDAMCQMADGDGRYLLNMCEELFHLAY